MLKLSREQAAKVMAGVAEVKRGASGLARKGCSAAEALVLQGLKAGRS